MGIYLTQVTKKPQEIGMEDYPADMMAFEKRFGGEQACLDYVAQLRWAG